MPRVEAYELLSPSERKMVDGLERSGSSIPKLQAAKTVWDSLSEFEKLRRSQEFSTNGMVSESPEADYRPRH